MEAPRLIESIGTTNLVAWNGLIWAVPQSLGPLGEPIHVDKNGETCQAGSGSIATNGWHGHLHNGVLFTS